MIRGMTGYGRSVTEDIGLRVTVEVRTVNHRYADVRLRLPRAVAGAEGDLRRRVSSRVRRGRADVTVDVQDLATGASGVRLNREAVQSLLLVSRALQEEFGIPGELDVAAVLRSPDVLGAPVAGETPDPRLLPLVEAGLDQALDSVEAMRVEEGRTIVEDLSRRLDLVGRLRGEIAARSREVPRLARARLERRIADLLPQGAAVEAGRLEQEVALLADRADVAEELVRLGGFIDQATAVLGGQDADAGRRLDFLMQEMNRETNTLGAKAADAEIGARVVDLKLEIERIREQVQNVE